MRRLEKLLISAACAGVGVGLAACGGPGTAPSVGQAEPTPSPTVPDAPAKTETPGSATPAAVKSKRGGFVLLPSDAAIYRNFEGTPVPSQPQDEVTRLGGPSTGTIFRVEERKGDRLRVSSIPTSRTPTPGCGVGIEALDPFVLEFWVDVSAPREVVTQRTTLEFSDGTAVELLAGTPVYQDEEGVWQADAWGTKIDLPQAPAKRGRFFKGVDHLTGSPTSTVPRDTKLRVGDVQVDGNELTGEDGNVAVFAKRDDMLWVQTACAQFKVVKDPNVSAKMPLFFGEAYGMKGVGGQKPNIGKHAVQPGHDLLWPDGSVAGKVRASFVFEGQRTPGEKDGLLCYAHRYAGTNVMLCPDPATAKSL